ncbi:hypothetical protein [Pseudoroseicyclus aestuarii]|uniref:Uncharacterized protein n=1 Tax=Pseudoroseicyclus aestuarii TaxID=1795041 RepID=A0A318SYJ8_9RHOB|nr:hypothetical protein [Pseudoroseicyclus aestuarii]PYE80797.1 hypothetical protein DFP88_1117 [Pseudoroseicyclus aestuarii]
MIVRVAIAVSTDGTSCARAATEALGDHPDALAAVRAAIEGQGRTVDRAGWLDIYTEHLGEPLPPLA